MALPGNAEACSSARSFIDGIGPKRILEPGVGGQFRAACLLLQYKPR